LPRLGAFRARDSGAHDHFASAPPGSGDRCPKVVQFGVRNFQFFKGHYGAQAVVA